MTTIYLVRHAEAEGNLYRRIHGWYNALVTDNGFAQIKALEERFRNISVDAVYSSDLYRTMTTARAVYVPKGLELHTDPELREVHMGDWEDQTWGGVRHFDTEGMDRFNHSDPGWRAPNGENLDEVGRRVSGAIRRIAEQHPNQTVAIFCHGTAIRQTLANIKGVAPQDWHSLGHSENTAVNCLTYEAGQFQIVLEGDASHLDESISTLAKQAWWRKNGKTSKDVNLWFRPINWEAEEHLYLEARHDAWTDTHGSAIFFDGAGFLEGARTSLRQSPWGVTLAMSGDKVIGILQLDTQRYSRDGAGYIPFCYIIPELREQSLGVQLIGQAVSFFRPLGRDKLRLRCAPYNDRAQHFYKKYGFAKVGEEQNSRVPLDIMEKYIGYER